jgi:hypothetical protein
VILGRENYTSALGQEWGLDNIVVIGEFYFDGDTARWKVFNSGHCNSSLQHRGAAQEQFGQMAPTLALPRSTRGGENV